MKELTDGRFIVLCLVVFQQCYGHPYFRDQIPNGWNVPNPCKPEETWLGVGHKLLAGSGARNTFGLDFADSGFKWTTTLCQKDSDFDGRTNGQELGDPNCTWAQGMTNPTEYTITHPGICEPWNDPKCLDRDQSWVMEACKPPEFKCDAINSPDVLNMTLTIPRTKVLPQETTYMCQIFNVPNDTDYHVIATTPIIDNVEIMHHALLFGCTDEVEVSNGAFQCGMSPSRHCSASIISLWAPGSSGQCMYNSTGFKIGAKGFRKLALQLHWNNPQLRDDYYDGSGLMMYYTPKLRDNDAGILTFGQTELLLPPGEPSVQQEGVYPAECSQRELKGNVYITSVINHMHYLGIAQSFELYRGGVKHMDLAVDVNYNYDNPKFHSFDPPIEIRPGDEFKTKCHYSTTKRSHTTRFGPATSDEMCFSFVSVYPRQNLPRMPTSSWKSIPYCNLFSGNTDGCDFRNFVSLQDPNHAQLYTDITTNCHLFSPCTPECSAAIEKAKQLRCLQGDIWEYIKRTELLRSAPYMEFLMRFQSCDCKDLQAPPQDITPITTENSKCDWQSLTTSLEQHHLFPIYLNVTSNCRPELCQKECIPVVLAAKKNPCFHGAEWHLGQRVLQQTANEIALLFLLTFDSCKCQTPPAPPENQTTTPVTTTPVTTTPKNTTPVTGGSSFVSGEMNTMFMTPLCLTFLKVFLL